MGPLPDEDTIPIQVSDTVTRGTVKPTYPVRSIPTDRETGGDAIANGFVYRGTLIPALRDKLVFGDITTGRMWYANRAEVLAADDGNPATVAPIYEIETDLRRLTEEKFRERGGKAQVLPGMAMVSGRGRVDVRFADDDAGELYVLTKSDGMIRKIVSARTTTAPAPTQVLPRRGGAQASHRSVGRRLSNPVMPTPASIAAGKKDLRRAVCRVSRESGAGRHQSRHRDLHHRGAEREAAAGSHRRRGGSRVDGRRCLHGHQARRAVDDDAGIHRAAYGRRRLAHRQLPARASDNEIGLAMATSTRPSVARSGASDVAASDRAKVATGNARSTDPVSGGMQP